MGWDFSVIQNLPGAGHHGVTGLGDKSYGLGVVLNRLYPVQGRAQSGWTLSGLELVPLLRRESRDDSESALAVRLQTMGNALRIGMNSCRCLDRVTVACDDRIAA